MPFLIAIIFVLILAPNTRWDMTAIGWTKATELCQPFGGVVAADEGIFWHEDNVITARCANGQIVKRVVPRTEYAPKK